MTGRKKTPKQCPRCDHNHEIFAAAGVVSLCPGQQAGPSATVPGTTPTGGKQR